MSKSGFANHRQISGQRATLSEVPRGRIGGKKPNLIELAVGKNEEQKSVFPSLSVCRSGQIVQWWLPLTKVCSGKH